MEFAVQMTSESCVDKVESALQGVNGEGLTQCRLLLGKVHC